MPKIIHQFHDEETEQDFVMFSDENGHVWTAKVVLQSIPPVGASESEMIAHAMDDFLDTPTDEVV